MTSLQRPAAFAGAFYPGDPRSCAQVVERLLKGAATPPAMGVVAPHAGWRYSGLTAAVGLAGIAGSKPETVVIFGAVHVADTNPASVFPGGIWLTPLGSTKVDETLAARVAQQREIIADPHPHRREHSIEVELPFIQHLLPEVMILPVMVRPGPWAEAVGRQCAQEALALSRRVVFVASTDLTHYGPAFDFEPYGHGEVGIRWAKEVNDRRFIRLIEGFDSGGVVPEAVANRNACGAGAVAATIAAVRELGASAYRELQHTTSADLELTEGFRPVNSVGYEGGVFIGDN